MLYCEDSSTVESEAIQSSDGGSTPTSSLHFNKISPKDLKISLCDISEVREFVEKNHYSHNINGVKISFCFKVNYLERLVGAVLFGQMSTTAWKKFANSEEKVLELRRLVLLDEVGKNSESRTIGFCIRTIKKISPVTEIIVSYADPQHGHEGIIYKASNFEFVGTSGKDKGFKDIDTGKIYHSRALRTKYKGDYKPFVKKLRGKLALGKLIQIDLPPKNCFVFRLKK